MLNIILLLSYFVKRSDVISDMFSEMKIRYAQEKPETINIIENIYLIQLTDIVLLLLIGNAQ